MPKKRNPNRRDSPFQELQRLLEKNNLPLKSTEPETANPRVEPAGDPEAERQLFKQAMDGVRPLRRDGRTRIPAT